MADLTPFQTIGPYFAVVYPDGESRPADPSLPVLALEGQILDGAGAPVPDAMVETWGADAGGRYLTAPSARPPGFARALADADGRFELRFSFPGPVPFERDRSQAPHLVLAVMGRGILGRLVTRVYFEGQPNDRDPLLALVPPERRSTLIASQASPERYRFEIRLQGARETVFFDV